MRKNLGGDALKENVICFTARVYYTDGTSKVMGFGSARECEFWCHDEGDHCLGWEQLDGVIG